MSMCTINAAGAAKQRIAVVDIEARPPMPIFKEALDALREQLRKELVNIGYDVVDNKRLQEVLSESEKNKDDSIMGTDFNLDLPTISVHGTVLSMNIKSVEQPQAALGALVRYIAQMEIEIGIHEIKAVPTARRKVIIADATKMFRKEDIETDKSKMIKWSRLVKPAVTEKTAKTSPAGSTELDEAVVKEAEYQIVLIPPEEKAVYDSCIQEAARKVVDALLEQFPVTLNIASVSDGMVYISFPEGYATGRIKGNTEFEILETKEITDSDTGMTLATSTRRVMTVRVDSLRPKMAICVPVTGKEKLSEVKEKIDKWAKELTAEKDSGKRAKMKPPFQLRQIENNQTQTGRPDIRTFPR